MKFIFIVLISIFSSISLYSCNTQRIDSLHAISITNKNLFTILDSIISHEKQCDYYNEGLVFNVFVTVRNKSYSDIQIGAIGNDIIRVGNELGCFMYRDHLFIVKGKQEVETLFSILKKYIQIDIYESKKEEDVITIDIFEDDSYSYWNYYYQDNIFIFESKYSMCK
jgi:hypothetical protein